MEKLRVFVVGNWEFLIQGRSIIISGEHYMYDLSGHFVTGSVVGNEGRIAEGHKLTRLQSQGTRKNMPFEVNAGAEQNSSNFLKPVDVSWLPAASQTYKISDDISDYVLVDIPAVTVCKAGMPNKNYQAFTTDEVLTYDPMMGMQIYKTFVGKGCHFEHNNKDPEKAKGVIFGSVLIPIPGYKYPMYKISILAGWDRTKDPELVKAIVNHERTGYSMGSIVKAFVCSITGAVVAPDTGRYRRGEEVKLSNGKRKLCYHLCTGSYFFEISSVAQPADVTAHGFNLGFLSPNR